MLINDLAKTETHGSPFFRGLWEGLPRKEGAADDTS